MLLVGGALLVALVLFTFVRLLAKPEMTALYSNMEPNDAQSLGEHLSAKNIRYQLSTDGRSVLVPADNWIRRGWRSLPPAHPKRTHGI